MTKIVGWYNLGQEYAPKHDLDRIGPVARPQKRPFSWMEGRKNRFHPRFWAFSWMNKGERLAQPLRIDKKVVSLQSRRFLTGVSDNDPGGVGEWLKPAVC